jgi:exopolysaccharide production protein ExoQ
MSSTADLSKKSSVSGWAVQPVRPAAPSLVVQLAFAFFLFFHFPAFTYQLAMNVSTGRWSGSPILQAATIGSELFAIIMILSSPNARGVAIRCWPIWLVIGLAFLSTTWSISPMSTLQSSNTSMSTMLLGMALVAWVPQFYGIRLVIRTMSVACVLSVIWVFIFSDTSVHQATDVFQAVHAGLWRGIFSHKQGLGLFAGITTGLLVFYNTKIFSLPALVVALGCSISCLVGSQSSTGLLTAVFTSVFFFVAQSVMRFEPELRRTHFVIFAIVAIAIGVAYKAGLFNFFIVQVLGKSTDLTGRATFWQIILTNFDNSGRTWLGGGFNAGFAADLYEQSVDNGYFDRLIEFGYLIAPIIYATYAIILYMAIKVVVWTPSSHAATNIFPFGIMSVILLINIVESNFMMKNASTLLTAMAVALIMQSNKARKAAMRAAGRHAMSAKATAVLKTNRQLSVGHVGIQG